MATGNSLHNKKFIIIWLDSEANNSEENLFTQQTLYQRFDNVEIYVDENECQQYIQSKPTSMFLIIVSGRLSTTIIPNIHGLQQVSGIYIFCFNKNKHEEWSKQYNKVIGIIVDLNALISQIHSDIRAHITKKTPTGKTDSTKHPTKHPTHASSTHTPTPTADDHDESREEREDVLDTTPVGTAPSPFDGYEKVPLVSLEQAVAPLIKVVDKVDQMAWIVKQNCTDPSDGLTVDESASIALLTLEWYSKDLTFNYILNETLRSENKKQIKPWLPYLKLVFKALSKLPSITRVVYQGKKIRVGKDYPNGKVFSSWEFLQCASGIRALEDEEDFGKEGQRTLFTIECRSGKSVKSHAHDTTKDHIVLLPGRQFKVVSCLDAGNDLTIVQLQELETSYKFK